MRRAGTMTVRRSARGGARWRGRLGRGPLVLALVCGALALVAAPAHADRGVAPRVGAEGFPVWYQDDAGRRVDLCLDSPFCSSVSTNLTPTAGQEATYWSAVARPPAALPGQTGRDRLVLALQAGFDPTTGVPMTAGTIRVRLRSLTPGATYTITHPFGTTEVVADAVDGSVDVTQAVGCVAPEEPPVVEPPPVAGPPARPVPLAAVACDFTAAQGSPLLGGFLRWDPGVEPQAPSGFLGDALTPHPVVGSPPGDNVFAVAGPGVPADARQTDFVVEGRLAAPVTPSPRSTDFGTQKVGTSGAPRSFTVQNTSGADVTLGAALLGGPAADQYQLLGPGDTGCVPGAVLADGDACTVQVSFDPTFVSFSAASLAFPSSGDGDNLVPRLRLTGLGAVPPAVLTDTLAFGDVPVGRAVTRPVVVENPSDVPLVVGPVLLTGSGDYAVVSSTCTQPVPSRGPCRVLVTYRPGGAGADAGALAVSHDAAPGPSLVPLTGRGLDVTAPAVTRLTVSPGTIDPRRRAS